MRMQPVEIDAELLLRAYAAGIFPMAEDADDPTLHWIEPRERGLIPLDGFHLSRRLARTVRADMYEIRVDHNFAGVIDACAAPRPNAPRTWINGRLRTLYGDLFRLGYAHTVEAYRDGLLVGGLYGVRLGAAFFGESMFHLARDASKVALVHLVARLRAGGFQLLDAQFRTDHLSQFGLVEVPRRHYRKLLDRAVVTPADFNACPRDGVSGVTVLAALDRSAPPQ